MRLGKPTMRFHVFPRSWQGYQDSCHWDELSWTKNNDAIDDNGWKVMMPWISMNEKP